MEKKRKAEEDRINTLAMLLGANFYKGVFVKIDNEVAFGMPTHYARYFDLHGNEITNAQAAAYQETYENSTYSWRTK